MTSSRRKTFDTFRKAGGMFGIDLAGLFQDDENGEGGFPEGFTPQLRVTSQLKGRSPSTATYKAPKTPARTAEFELLPETKSVTPAAMEAQPAEQAAAAPAAAAPASQQMPQMQPQQLEEPKAASDEFATRIAGAYQREFGRDPLQQEIEDWRGTGLGVQEAERQLDIHPFRNFDKAVTEYYNVTMGRAPVQSEIEDWRGTGYSLGDIKSNLMTIAQREKGGASQTVTQPAAQTVTQPATQPVAQQSAADPFAQQVAAFYQQSLGRTPAAKEIEDWRGTGQNISQIQGNLALIGSRR